jgi:uncharacterized protein (TIGR03437 family)
VSAASPAKAGEFLVAYLAGPGDTDHTVVTGDASPSSPLVQLRLNVGTAANVPVAFDGLMPGLAPAGNLNVTDE